MLFVLTATATPGVKVYGAPGVLEFAGAIGAGVAPGAIAEDPMGAVGAIGAMLGIETGATVAGWGGGAVGAIGALPPGALPHRAATPAIARKGKILVLIF